MKSREDLLNEARQEIPEMTIQEVHDYLKKGENPALLDVRGLDEWERGHLEGAIHIPRGRLESDVEANLPDKSREVVVYCAGGVRSLSARGRVDGRSRAAGDHAEGGALQLQAGAAGAFGAEDFTADMAVPRTEEGTEIAVARGFR